MTDPRSPFATSLRELPAEEASREERHQLLATLLGAFADGELPAETASQIDAHLLGCGRCRREILVQRTLRLRLEQEPLETAPTAFRDRILSTIAATPAPQWQVVAESVSTPERVSGAPESEPGLLRRLGRAGVVAAVILMLAAGALGVRWVVQRFGAPQLSVVASSSVPLFTAALADYRRVMNGDLPGRARDLAGVRDAVPFPVQALQDPSLRLLAAWTTSLNGEPAAVLAYRRNDQVVLQYLVSELQLYRPAEVRSAFGNGYLLATHDGAENIVAWPEPASGSLVVANIGLDRLKALRGVVAPR
jgi:anti-sigma factor RsiW